MVPSHAASSSFFSTSWQPSSSPFHHHPQGQGSTADSTGPIPFIKEFPPPENRNLRVDSARPATSHCISSEGELDRLSGVSGFSSGSRSISVDLGRKATIATATTVVRIRPVLRVDFRGISRSPPVLPQKALRVGSPVTTPSSTTSDQYSHWTQEPSLRATASESLVLPELNLRPESDDFSKIPGLTTSQSIQQAAPRALSPPSSLQPSPRTQTGPSRLTHSRSGSRNRSRLQKAMLESALERAHTAVTLDHAGNFEGAMEAYKDACALLSDVMGRAGEDGDRAKLQNIKNTYMERINEIKALPQPIYKEYERSLPPRPLTEEFTDEASLYTIDDDESTLVPFNAPSVGPHSNAPSRVTPVPPRRDSLYMGPRVAPFRHVPSQNIIPTPLSPIRGSPPRRAAGVLEPKSEMGLHRVSGRDSSAFGAPALSPRSSPRKAADYDIRRSASDASSRSSRSFQLDHSRHGSEEVSTSWLNTIDESGSSVGEPSPLWVRKSKSSPSQPEHIGISDTDFDAQLDAAVEAAYDDGYQVDYSFDVDEELMILQSPRENVEKAKARVKEVEREMEIEIQKERDRRLRFERDRAFSMSKRDSDLDFFDDADDDDDDESEEERILEEMTRGYTLDFDFELDTKMALPRESTSTQYSDGTLGRGSMSSGYSSGTTWGSGLTTVAEKPTTPLLLPSVPLEELGFDDIGPSPSEPPPPTPSFPPPFLPPLPPLPPPTNGLVPPGLAVSKPGSVRSRRLSALAEPLEPLKIETSKTPPLPPLDAGIPTTVVLGPSPQIQPPSAPTTDPPPIPLLPAQNDGLKSPAPHDVPRSPLCRDIPSASRPGTSHDQDTDTDQPLHMKGGRPPSPTVPNLPKSSAGLTAIPLQKTVSDDGLSAIPRADSTARIGYTPKIQAIPPLRQIHSSASLRSRNPVNPEADSPSTPMNNLFASSSTSNLRKGLSRSTTPAAVGFAMTPLHPAPPTPGGMSFFDSKIHSPNALGNGMDHHVTLDAPIPLEPCPPETLSRPFWLMRCFYQTIAHPRGGYISPKLFVPREVWYIKGVKIKAVDDKINACDLVTAALQKLAKVKQDQVNSIFEEMQALEGVLDRAQTMLSKKLGNEVGGPGAKTLYGDNSHGGDDNMVTTKTGNVSGGKGYFSLRKLRTKTSSNALGPTYGSGVAANTESYTILPMAGAHADVSLQPKREIDSVAFGGPHATYLAALAKLFDSAQVLDRLAVFDEDVNVPIKLRVGFELSHRHASEFFGFFICRFVLADVTVLLDKFVKRGSECVSQ